MTVHDTLIIGAGFTGLGAAIKLTEAGVDDIVILERSDRVGGTWRDNTYPGVACDIPSLLYSYSFVKNPSWSRAYPSGAEICTHIEEMVDTFGLRPRIRFRTTVTGLSFDEDAGVWTVNIKGRKKFQARTVVMAAGPLADHKFPDIRGIESYQGHKIHSAGWDHDYDFTGKRVGVIGTGASAVQIVPELVKTAAFVKVFQRTPGWCCRGWMSRCPLPCRACSRKFPPPKMLRAKPCSGAMRPAPPRWYGTPRCRRWSPGWERHTCAGRWPTPGCAAN